MTRYLYFIIGLLLFNNLSMMAQDKTFEEKAKVLKLRIEKITSEERSLLKETIKDITRRLNAQEITAEEAQKLKEKAAHNSAKTIQSRIAPIEKSLQNLIKNDVVDKTLYKEENYKRFSIGGFDVDYTKHYNRRSHKKYWSRRTHTYTVLSLGLNNIATNNNLGGIDNSAFDFWKSRYIEIGSNSKTRIFKNGGLFYFDFGFSFISSMLYPKQNQFFEINGTTTDLKVHSENLDKSKFKNLQLIFPAYLEMDFSRPYRDDDQMRFRPNRGFKMGFGGFLGVNLKTKQVLKYDINDVKVRDVKKGDFNVSNFLYGLNAFIGHRDTSFFVRYYLNPLFKNNNIDQNNVAFGLRFDW